LALWSGAHRCRTLEGPLSTPDTSPFRELVGSGRSGLAVQPAARCRWCAPVVSYVRCGDPHKPPIGIKVLEPATCFGTPGTVCPQKILGSRSCPRLEDSRSELLRRTECQHVVARDLGASPAKSKRRGAGAQSSEDSLSQAPSRSSLFPAEVNRRLALPGTALGRASHRSRREPFCGLLPSRRQEGWYEPFFVRSTSWPAARIGWRSARLR
jgi:hypothetical protein